MEKKWNIRPEDIRDDKVANDLDNKWDGAASIMRQRTSLHEFFTLVAHNMSLYEKKRKDAFSEGTTQAIKRKSLAQTIQRVPDGEVVTQFDKNSIEQVETEFIFNKKVITSEIDGKDMLKNLTRSFKTSYDFGYAPVRTGFEKDLDGDVRITYTEIQWNNIYPSPDCDYIEEAPWYLVREYTSRSELEALLDEEGNCRDSTYNEDVVKYLVENEIKTGIEPRSNNLADKKNSVMPIESVEIRTLYRRGDSEFVTYVPQTRSVLRTTRNYDPRKDVPLHFLILDPDPEFPLGCSSVMWTLAQQQFADAFQTSSYQELLIAVNPPLMGFGNLTPAKIKMKPKAYWPMGTNPNNKLEKFPIESTTLTQYGSILENVSGNMMKNMNIMEGTVASDANVSHYSATPQGVEMQRTDKTITINQLQKRVEVFFSEWANHALRSYINATTGSIELTVDEKTRRKIWDVETSLAKDAEMQGEKPPASIINGDKVLVDFDALSTDMLSFAVRTGSLIENEKEEERRNIQELLVPISQMLNGVSEKNKPVFEDTILQLMQRLCELSNVDISQQAADRFDEQLMMQAMEAMMQQVMGQQQQINQMQQALMPPQAQPQLPPGEQIPDQLPEQPLQDMQALPPDNANAPLPPEVSAEFPEAAVEPSEQEMIAA
jgi:hypothetical protein